MYLAQENNSELVEKLLSIKINKMRMNYGEEIYTKFHSEMKESVPSFVEKMSSCAGDSDRITVVKKHFEWTPLGLDTKSLYTKSSNMSTILRNLGNAAFQEHRDLDALSLYNIAILFATPGDPELGLAYANRSAVLNSMDYTEEAIKDIASALSNGYPYESDKRKKLIDREIRFNQRLLDQRKNPAFEEQLKIELSTRNEFYKEMFTLKSPNTLAPAMEDSVDIKWSSTRGRHLVVNRDVPVGATVIVERPFLAVLTKALNWDVDHCHHCMKKNFRCIPCPNCVFTQYCNETCREEARTSHQYECPCLTELHSVLMNLAWKCNFHLAFKIICFLGPQSLFTMYNDRKQNATNCILNHASKSCATNKYYNNIPGSDPDTGIYESKSYPAFYSLMTDRLPIEVDLVFILALTLSRTLDSNTHFFASLTYRDETEKGDFQDFIAELMIHHFEAFRRNAFELREFTDVDGMTLRTYLKSTPEGVLKKAQKAIAGIFTTVSLTNHSCAQNVVKFVGNRWGVMAIVALKPLKAGEELVMSYGPVYGGCDGSSPFERQVLLKKNYKFLCACIACKNDWPGMSHLMENQNIPNSHNIQFCCPQCASKFPHESKMSPDFLKCKLTRSSQCKVCNSPYEHVRQTMTQEYILKANQLYIYIDNLNRGKNPSAEEAISIINQIKVDLQYFENNACPPNYHCLLASPLYRELVNLIILFSNYEA